MQKFKAFLKLIRIQNILFFLFSWSAAIACVLRFDLFEQPFLKWFLSEYLVLGFAIGFIMAGAYAINDYYDLSTDVVNRKSAIVLGTVFRKRTGLTTHWITSFLGCSIISAWAYFSDAITWEIIPISIGMVILLVWYSTYLKSVALIGNIVIAFSIGTAFLLPAFTLPDYVSSKQANELKMILQFLAVFAFGSNLLREWAKDMLDKPGDKQAGRKTLPIIFSWKSNKLGGMLVNSFYIIALILYWFSFYKYITLKSLIFLIFLSVAPLLYVNFLIFKSQSPKDFQLIVFLYKLIMFTGILGILWMEF